MMSKEIFGLILWPKITPQPYWEPHTSYWENVGH